MARLPIAVSRAHTYLRKVAEDLGGPPVIEGMSFYSTPTGQWISFSDTGHRLFWDPDNVITQLKYLLCLHQLVRYHDASLSDRICTTTLGLTKLLDNRGAPPEA